ncbi:hypothetical protein PTSG_04883 [Salpingoeca rosetta]|uniref:Uncharacterized protein n=1 Tax=Salpingoeca rosetta (strain ATCC 50818 / BSB-021) TaxID=946362 RepID=F2U8W7_SALR5|nr:uncharacterized protein PTSG_04883 [Salpingoeca rosetta]EGD73170.1 hypothetical protein PTSG_04883 [Salpingoeca rosetta]|eukprot:XP_004994201.1 hypothetical protein PTSG_04883 [Salpingoeca rosetta]
MKPASPKGGAVNIEVPPVQQKHTTTSMGDRYRGGLAAAIVFLIVFSAYVIYVWTPIGLSLTAADFSVTSSEAVDAFVFICMGTWTNTTILHNAVSSLRTTGGWEGEVYVITDRQDGWPSLRDKYSVNVIGVDAVASKLAIHSFKCQMFDVLPAHVHNVLYMDADIVVSRPLMPFFKYLSNHKTEHPSSNLGFFRDSRGHFFGTCAECDYWHGGVMQAVRNVSEPCLHKWCEAIFSGRFPADQPALDYISKEERECRHMFVMDSRFLMFMKDYASVFLRPAKTFSHVTAFGRLNEQTWFYRLIVYLKLGVAM